jgi:CDP-glycerol glycerophosphotransferase (TagB/SpsB family)
MLKRLCVQLAETFGSLLGWLVVAPIALLMPRRKDWMAVIGRDDGKFVDNAKYFFLQGTKFLANDIRIVFISERDDVVSLLTECDCDVLGYPTWKAIWFLLRVNTVVVDSIEWVSKFRRQILVGSKVLQLWHGVGFKRIERDQWRNGLTKGELGKSMRYIAKMLVFSLRGRLVKYSAVVATSTFYKEQVFEKAFLSDIFLVSGYPRNAFQKMDVDVLGQSWLNVDRSLSASVLEWIADARRIILVAPTFRDSGRTSLSLSPETQKEINDWCEEHAIEIIFKFHPYDRNATRIKGRHLHICDSATDVYPIMPLTCALVTDYSSIYMDYLFLEKPIFFLRNDLTEYESSDRPLQFNIEQMTPGAKYLSFLDALEDFEHQLRDDSYQSKRQKLRQIAFDDLPQEQSIKTLVTFMRNRSWIQH